MKRGMKIAPEAPELANRADLALDRLLYGVAFVDDEGNRVPPHEVRWDHETGTARRVRTLAGKAPETTATEMNATARPEGIR